MKKVAIFMSDFHLGQKDRMEEFHADEEFAELIGRLSLSHVGDFVDLVLLGDVLDLWTTIAPGERDRAQTIAEVDLRLPAISAADYTEALRRETEKVREIVRCHHVFFESLGRFLVADGQRRTLYYVPGNHDHSVVAPSLQTIITDAVLTEDVLGEARIRDRRLIDALRRHVVFRLSYRNRCLGVYAEHGNQLTYAGIFRYANQANASTFAEFGDECPGYILFKLVSHRVERNAPRLNGLLMGAFSPGNWPGLLWWLVFRGYFRAFVWYRNFHIQYLLEPTNPRIAIARQALPSSWKTLVYLVRERLWSGTGDEFDVNIRKLFDREDPGMLPLTGTKLKPEDVRIIVLGHTHAARDVDMPGFRGLKYYNTGSWILQRQRGRDVMEQTWVSIETDMAQAIERFESRVVASRMCRRRLDVASTNRSAVTRDGARMLSLLPEMKDLRVGDIVLLHANYGRQLSRLAKSAPIGEFLDALQHMAIGLINRVGTSCYWNHVALIYGTPTEAAESTHYSDVLIIEAVPETGVSVHTTERYLKYSGEWDFAVLRLRSPLVTEWSHRVMLRRLVQDALESEYDSDTVRRGTIKYAALTMNSKGRSALSGLVQGAVLSVVVSTGLLAWYVYERASDWVYRAHDAFLANPVMYLDRFDAWRADAHRWALQFVQLEPVSPIEAAIKAVGVVIGLLVLPFFMGRLWQIVRDAWIMGTALIGAAVGAFIVPVLADITAAKQTPHTPQRRWFFTVAWVVLLFGLVWIGTAVLEWFFGDPRDAPDTVARRHRKIEIIMGLLAAMMPVWFVRSLDQYAGLFWNVIKRARALATRGRHALYRWLHWPIPRWPSCGRFALHKAFICSGLVQDAFVELAKRLRPRDTDAIANVMTNPLWTPTMDPAEQNCTIRDTLPRDFALSPKLAWIYLQLDGRLTASPSANYITQAYTAPSADRPGALLPIAVRACKVCYAAFFGTVLAAFADGRTAAFLNSWACGVSHGWLIDWLLRCPYTPESVRAAYLWSAALLAAFGLRLARRARNELIRNPALRGRALTFAAFVSGSLALFFAVGSLDMFEYPLKAVLQGGVIVAGLFAGLMLVL